MCNSSCNVEKRKNDFIAKARKVHGDRYDYSEVNYVNNKIKVIIVCEEHGRFEQDPNNHLKGKGCRSCSNNTLKTNDEYVEQAKKVHGEKYDYQCTDYKNGKSKVKINCHKHGIFEKIAGDHLRGFGCPDCVFDDISISLKNDFFKKAKDVHGDRYDYSKVKYIAMISKIQLNCKEHGNFSIVAKTHLSSEGYCPKCKNRDKVEDFKYKAKSVHGELYDYSKIKKYSKKVEIVCKKHGSFIQCSSKHITCQSGCPRCNNSKGEKAVGKFLKRLKLDFKDQVRFEKCRGVNNRKLVFDFFLPSLNMVIEFDGRQHFDKIDFFGGEKIFKTQIENDKIKNDFCMKNNINMLRIKFNENVNKAIVRMLRNIKADKTLHLFYGEKIIG